jgi:hypothetical protein
MRENGTIGKTGKSLLHFFTLCSLALAFSRCRFCWLFSPFHTTYCRLYRALPFNPPNFDGIKICRDGSTMRFERRSVSAQLQFLRRICPYDRGSSLRRQMYFALAHGVERESRIRGPASNPSDSSGFRKRRQHLEVDNMLGHYVYYPGILSKHCGRPFRQSRRRPERLSEAPRHASHS